MSSRVRRLLLLAHRWVGLVLAGFLIMAGLTGAVISWDHELDDLLNRHLTKSSTTGTPLPSLELARRIERADPHVRVTSVPLTPEAGDSLAISVEPRVDPSTGRLYDPGYNEVFLDPVSGREIGRREWGKPALTRENFVPFLYVLHYSLQIPDIGGNDRWGIWLMGTIALVWTLDCFVGFYLTLPRRAGRTTAASPTLRPAPSADGDDDPSVVAVGSTSWWRRWKPAWQIKWSGSGRRINFDLHRAAGLWAWVFLFILALSGMSMNLYTEVAQPLVRLVSDFTPTPYDIRPPKPPTQPIEPRVSMSEVVARAQVEGRHRGWTVPVGAVSYASLYGVFAASFFEPGGDHGAAGVGPPALYFDSADGHYLGDFIPWAGTAGDLFLQVQFPLHSGRIAGLPGRIFISFMGLVVVALSVTGVVIWWQKRSASMLIASRGSDRVTATPTPMLTNEEPGAISR